MQGVKELMCVLKKEVVRRDSLLKNMDVRSTSLTPCVKVRLER